MFLNVLNESAGLNVGNLDHIQPTNNGYDGEAGAYQILFESATEWNNLSMAMANLEAKAFLESNDLLLEAGVSSFVDAAKDFFMKAWAKIQELFKQFTTWLQASVSSDQKFYSKFKDKVGSLGANLPDDFKYKMIKGVTIESIDSHLVAGVNYVDSEVNKLVGKLTTPGGQVASMTAHKDTKRISSDSVSGSADAARGHFCGTSSGVSSGEFRKEFLDACCGGDSTPDDVSKSDMQFAKWMEFIKDSKASIKALKDTKDKLSSTYSKIIASLNKAAKKVGNGSSVTGKEEKISLTRLGNADGDSNMSDNKSHGMSKYSGETTKGDVTYSSNKSDLVGHYGAGISNAISEIKAITSVATEAYGIAITLVKKLRAQYRGCLTKALTSGAKGVKIENEGMSSDNLLAQFGYMN